MPGNDSQGKPDEHVEILDVSEYKPRRVRVRSLIHEFSLPLTSSMLTIMPIINSVKVKNVVIYNKWDVPLIPPSSVTLQC